MISERNKVKVGGLGMLLAIVGLVLMALKFRNGWQVSYSPFVVITVIGAVMAATIALGKTIGPIVSMLGAIVLAFGVFAWFMDKHDASGAYKTIGFGISVIVLGGVVGSLGSSEADKAQTDSLREAREMQRRFCARCGDYLGDAGNFSCPCPRCGSNRWSWKDPLSG